MEHGSQAARPTTTLGSEANIGSATFDDGQLGAAAAPPGSFADFDLSAVAGRGEVPVGVAYHTIREFGRQLGPVDAVRVGPQRSDGVVQVHHSSLYSALQPGPGAGRRAVLAVADLLTGAFRTVCTGNYALQPHPGAGHGEVLVNLLPDDAAAGHGEAFVGELPDGGVAAYDDYGFYALQPCPGAGHGEVLVDLLRHGAGHGELFVGFTPGGVDADNYGYYALQPRPGAGHGQVLVDLLPDGAGHGEVFVGLLPGGGGAVHDDYGYYACQPSPGAGLGEVFIGPLPDGVSMVYDGNFAQQTLPATARADGIAGALRVPNLGAVYDNRGTVAEQLRRLLPFTGIGASSVAVNGLAAGPGSPAVAFHLFVLLLGGLFLVIQHVLRV